jgi:tRNA isopentenyl-2-thiomethyl-A-37 hydroxylase MiaE
VAETPKPEIRKFSTGATRDVDHGKMDPEAFLDPLVLGEYFEFMHKHRFQKDGSMRDGDNWTKGFPRQSIMKSLWRHFYDVWRMHRGLAPKSDDCIKIYDERGKQAAQVEAFCGVIFNGFAYMREVLLGREIEE